MTATNELLKAQKEARDVIEVPDGAEFIGYASNKGIMFRYYRFDGEYYSTNEKTLEFDRKMKEAQKRHDRERRKKRAMC